MNIFTWVWSKTRCTPSSDPASHILKICCCESKLFENFFKYNLKRLPVKHAVAMDGICPRGTFELSLRIATLLLKVDDENCGWTNTRATLNSWKGTGSLVVKGSHSPNLTLSWMPLVLRNILNVKMVENFEVKRFYRNELTLWATVKICWWSIKTPIPT